MKIMNLIKENGLRIEIIIPKKEYWSNFRKASKMGIENYYPYMNRYYRNYFIYSSNGRNFITDYFRN